MTPISAIEEIRNLIAGIRNMRKGFLTNFYLDEFKHNVWIQKGVFFYEQIGETLFFVKKSETFSNLFYNSTSIGSLSEDLMEFKTKNPQMVLIVDIVGRDNQCVPLVEAFQKLGFSQTTSLVRMSRATEIQEYQPNSSIALAGSDDVAQIHELLHKYFDEKTEQIPYLDELKVYAQNGHVLVCHENDRLAGFVIYEMNATTLYLRYWFTHPDFRDKKVGSRLLRRFFEEGKNTKRQLFWVVCSNENAIKRYCHYGFKEENMFDYVMQN